MTQMCHPDRRSPRRPKWRDLRFTAPDHYSAHLVARTVNGGISVDFPVTVQGTLKNRLDTNLGQGGPTIHLQTVNGGVSISRK